MLSNIWSKAHQYGHAYRLDRRAQEASHWRGCSTKSRQASASFHSSLGANKASNVCSAVSADQGTEEKYEGSVGEEAAGQPGFAAFHAATRRGNIVPIYERLFSDRITPVLAYRSLVAPGDHTSPSFLLESVISGSQQGRYSFVGARPALEVLAKEHEVTVINHMAGTRTVTHEEDPLSVPQRLSADWQPVTPEGLPAVFTGGWVGYCGYDTVRYTYAGKLPFSSAPPDQDGLLDMHLALYNEVVLFDQATKLCFCVVWLHTGSHASPHHAFLHGQQRLAALSARIAAGPPSDIPPGKARLSLTQSPLPPRSSNVSHAQFCSAVEAAREHIQAGNVFQLVLSQRFRRSTLADPFEIYRALRVVNPSPYMIHMQARGSILVASSPEILCRVGPDGTVTNRPLAGTRRRGRTPAEDEALERELLADEKECSEHVMLVDLGRNDVGKVVEPGSVKLDVFMEVERYSHVMHISSTVTGRLRAPNTAWDALRAALPVGTVSGAPKVRAMQIIDELETVRRGPYGGGIGVVAFSGAMDMALALRTMVIPSAPRDCLYDYYGTGRREWLVNLQAGAGVVADSEPNAEYEETVNKAAALGRAIDLAEQAFL